MKDFFDDKIVVIISVTVLGLALILTPNISDQIIKSINPIFTGLFGLAVGQSIKK